MARRSALAPSTGGACSLFSPHSTLAKGEPRPRRRGVLGGGVVGLRAEEGLRAATDQDMEIIGQVRVRALQPARRALPW